MEKISIRTNKRVDLVDVTQKIQELVARGNVQDGVCFIFVPHTTAALTINENADPSVKEDLLTALNRIAPAGAGYRHTEGNADAHIKSSLFGNSLTLFIEAGQLLLGTWQGIYFCEGDGPRTREIWVKIISKK